MDSSDERKPLGGDRSGSDDGSNGEREKLSRREWLVELGETAAAIGLGGPALEKARAVAGTGATPSQQLPFGLYEPSFDKLTHAMSNDSRFHTVPVGTETDYVLPSRGPYVPLFFSQDELETVRKLVRVMLNADSSASATSRSEQLDQANEEISEWLDLELSREPEVRDAARTISPQHRELAVYYYGAEDIRRTETRNIQKDWRDGLGWLAAESSRRHGKPPASLSDLELASILRQAESHVIGAASADAGARFFKLLKARVIEGYYTSKAGLAELGASRHSFHAQSPGCAKKNSPA